ncbi:acyl-CoA thioesterase [Saccharibacillus alkalitolerans]|uniref:Acyl-CoA thioesterase n=1 Tax=Saccharibacillus alkalitolerans TaxID=2705290 RepID=A0ABX0F4C2_9BACL|nr:thioesterase family protein [Saccharibacillus alkalitolerans]NGZ75816.1 acyl-CoA thioesterase [Saccharibacillus alkalitolerans]
MGNSEAKHSVAHGRWFRTGLKVRYQETDQMSVVYHANYLNWFEIGRTEMIRAVGLTYRAIEEQGVYLPVLEARARFVSPARYDDRIWIYSRISAFSPLRLEYEYEIRRCEDESQWSADTAVFGGEAERPGTLLNIGGTEHIWLNAAWKPIRLNKAAPDVYKRLGSWLAAESAEQGGDSHEEQK